MIKVIQQEELVLFEEKVRIPGQAFLMKVPNPTANQWKSHNYWGIINSDFYKCYSGICAYTGMWFSLSSNDASVDHFMPKAHYPSLAYEWNNYRLTTIKTNRKKGAKIIVDPFAIENGWFILDIPSYLVKCSSELSEEQKRLVEYTIEVLELNSDDNMVQERLNIIKDYSQGHIDFDFLQRRYPFIASELSRQNLKENIGDYIKTITQYY